MTGTTIKSPRRTTPINLARTRIDNTSTFSYPDSVRSEPCLHLLLYPTVVYLRQHSKNSIYISYTEEPFNMKATSKEVQEEDDDEESNAWQQGRGHAREFREGQMPSTYVAPKHMHWTNWDAQTSPCCRRNVTDRSKAIRRPIGTTKTLTDTCLTCIRLSRCKGTSIDHNGKCQNCQGHGDRLKSKRRYYWKDEAPSTMSSTICMRMERTTM